MPLDWEGAASIAKLWSLMRAGQAMAAQARHEPWHFLTTEARVR